LTGLPLKFSDRPWAESLMRMLGGTEAARLAHRFFALLMFGYVVLHLIHLARAARRGKGSLRARIFGPHSMLPLGRDWRQFCQMLRWFFGRAAKPTFDRWTYWEKFDYWADVVGTVIIGGSGLLLWFPTFFAALLSGYWFNIATIIHGYEALLAIGFIFTIHFFNAHLRWDKFPVDLVIFTGQLDEEEFRAERGLQYARLRSAGELEELRVPPAPRWQRHLARIVGPLALLIGYALVGLIIWAALQ
jgi:cytochrome b subunit of formate dehydrogenase